MPARPPRPPDLEKNYIPKQGHFKQGQLSSGRFNKWAHGWLLGGLKSSLAELKGTAKPIDYRNPQSVIEGLSMMVPGKASGENAMAAHLGHSEFRPMEHTDPFTYGGAAAAGRDIGYPTSNRFAGRTAQQALQQLLLGRQPDNLVGKLMGKPYGSWTRAKN